MSREWDKAIEQLIKIKGDVISKKLIEYMQNNSITDEWNGVYDAMKYLMCK